VDPELTQIMRLYIDRFNHRDWDGVRELIRADARLNVADRFAGNLADAPYFSNYEKCRCTGNWPQGNWTANRWRSSCNRAQISGRLTPSSACTSLETGSSV